MKILKCVVVVVLQQLASYNCTLNAQNAAVSPKPGITINGTQWLIQNTIWSCMTRYCDSLVVMTGDSVEFCTGQQISLNTDSAYYMEWHFNGSANYPFAFRDSYPSSLPLCYNPIWNVPGVYIVDVYYNGWLTAYPQSDCYSFGPSHWTIDIHVVQNPNEINEINSRAITIYPNPTKDVLFIPELSNVSSVEVYNCQGQLQLTSTNCTSVDCSQLARGLYIVNIKDKENCYRTTFIKE